MAVVPAPYVKNTQSVSYLRRADKKDHALQAYTHFGLVSTGSFLGSDLVDLKNIHCLLFSLLVVPDHGKM